MTSLLGTGKPLTFYYSVAGANIRYALAMKMPSTLRSTVKYSHKKQSKIILDYKTYNIENNPYKEAPEIDFYGAGDEIKLNCLPEPEPKL